MSNMRIRLIYVFGLFIFSSLATTGCKKIDQWSQINIPFSRTFPIPATAEESITIDFTSPAVSTQDNFISQNIDLENEKLESITLDEMTLLLDSATQVELSYLEFIELYILSDNVDEVKIAWQDDIPDDVGKELEMQVSSRDLQSFIQEDSISIKLVGSTDEAIVEDHDLTVDSKFVMDLKILGQ